jgi:hypothetical protein
LKGVIEIIALLAEEAQKGVVKGTNQEHTMVRIAGLCFVIADNSHARFVRLGSDNRPHTFRTVDRFAVSDTAAVEPDGFALELTQSINEDFAVDLFTELVVIAPGYILGQLMAMIEVPADGKLDGGVAANLLDMPDDQLGPHLEQWVRPAHPA